MTTFRTEILFDAATGLFFTEFYFPQDTAVPEFATAPIYGSPQEAERDAARVFQFVFSDMMDAIAA